MWKKIFANDLLFLHSRENVCDSLHSWARAHNELTFFLFLWIARERSTIWLTLTCCVLCILVVMHDRCFAGEVGIHDNERGR